MDHIKLEEQLTKRLPTFSLVFGQFMLTPLILSGVCWMVTGQKIATLAVRPNAQQEAIIISIFAAALLLLGDNFGDLVRKSQQGRPAAENSDPESRFLNREFTSTLVTFVCFEGASILGFVASYLTHEVIWCAVLSVLSIVAMFREMPTGAKLRAKAQEFSPTV